MQLKDHGMLALVSCLCMSTSSVMGIYSDDACQQIIKDLDLLPDTAIPDRRRLPKKLQKERIENMLDAFAEGR